MSSRGHQYKPKYIVYLFDSASQKTRPVLIIQTQNNHLGYVVIRFSASHGSLSDGREIIFNKNHRDFVAPGLSRESILRVDNIATVRERIIHSKIGEISDNTFKTIKEKLQQLFQ